MTREICTLFNPGPRDLGEVKPHFLTKILKALSQSKEKVTPRRRYLDPEVASPPGFACGPAAAPPRTPSVAAHSGSRNTLRGRQSR